MDLSIDREDWNVFIKKFNRRNLLRSSKLQICDENGVATEVKLMPFLGLDIEKKGENAPTVNIVLGDNTANGRHFCHNVENVHKLILKEDKVGQDEVLNIENENSEITLLTFESSLSFSD